MQANGKLYQTDTMKILYIPIFFLIIAAACKSKSNYRKAADEIAANSQGTTNMNAGKRNYSLYIPEGWTSEHRNAYGVDCYFILAPKTATDPNTNINVVTEYMQNLGLDEYKARTIESIKKAIPSASILAQGDINANGLKGGWYSYSMVPQGIEATLVCYIFPQDSVAYIITAGTQTKDASRYRSTFDSVARSFKFVD